VLERAKDGGLLHGFLAIFEREGGEMDFFDHNRLAIGLASAKHRFAIAAFPKVFDAIVGLHGELAARRERWGFQLKTIEPVL
jgi:hypothetical protein